MIPGNLMGVGRVSVEYNQPYLWKIQQHIQSHLIVHHLFKTASSVCRTQRFAGSYHSLWITVNIHIMGCDKQNLIVKILYFKQIK